MAPLLSMRWSVALAAVSGLVMWLAFAPVAIGPLAIAAVALLTAAVWGAGVRRGMGLGLVTGLVFFLLLLGWMRVVGTDAWLLLGAYCAAWIAFVGGATALVSRLPVAPLWIGSVWVLEEALRGRVPFGGFPWGNLAFAQPDTVFVSLSAVGGTPFVTFVIAVLGAAVVAAVVDHRAGRRRWAGAWLATALALCLVPALVPLAVDGDSEGGVETAVVAVVQGGTPQFGLTAMDVRRAVLDNHVAQTLALAEAIAEGRAPQPHFVLWPENSSDIDPFSDASVADAITSAARAVQAPILVGAVITAGTDPSGVWNVGIVWDPVLGPQEMYIKTHPVPFGEYIPFRSLLAGRIDRFALIPRDYLAGDRPGNLDIGGVAIGNVICFEIAYGEVVDAVVDGGARLVTVQTNNATYGGTPQPAQQLAISRMRAVEFGRTVAVAATSGISAFIDASGEVTQRMDEGEAGWLVEEVALRGGLTLASRIGHAVEAILCAVAVGALAVAIAGAVAEARSARRRRGTIA